VPSGPQETISLLSRILDQDTRIDAGRPLDTIFVNHDVSEVLPEARAGREWLDARNGQPTRSGIIRVLHRPWARGIGGSFASFNFAFKALRDRYEYWFFTEDDVMPIANGYYAQAVRQLQTNKRVAYVCAWRYERLDMKALAPHCHGGCGATHISFLNRIYHERGSLPFSPLPMPGAVLWGLQEGQDNKASQSEVEEWYRRFEQDGEVAFTNAFVQQGYALEDIKIREPVVECYGKPERKPGTPQRLLASFRDYLHRL
jgi:hypothetical protein